MSILDESLLIAQIDALIGPGRTRPPAGIERGVARTIVEPASVEEITELVRKFEAERISAAPLGAARTLSTLRRIPVDAGVSMRRLAAKVAYEPHDMTITVEAGITLERVNRETGVHRQHLPLDPPVPSLTTIGAAVAASKSGPLRLSGGTVRDLILGIQFVGHGGRIARAGGRVVKNVAGYDLMRVMTGSFGTLGIVTEATFKVVTRPELYSLGMASFEFPAIAFEAARRLHDRLALTHLEILSPQPGRTLKLGGKYTLIAGFSGNAPEMAHQRDIVAREIDSAVEFAEGEAAVEVYKRLRDLEMPSATIAGMLAVLPARLGGFLDGSGLEFCAHAGTGVARVFYPGDFKAAGASRRVSELRALAHRAQGHFRLTACAPALRDGLEIFDEPGEGSMKLMRGLKRAFDPAGIFNPRTFVGGL